MTHDESPMKVIPEVFVVSFVWMRLIVRCVYVMFMDVEESFVFVQLGTFQLPETLLQTLKNR